MLHWSFILIANLICSCLNFVTLKKSIYLNESVDKIPISSYIIASIYSLYGKLMHGYEIDGMQNIPLKGPAIIVFYHGAMPWDHFFLWSHMILLGRNIRTVGDKFIFNNPGNINF